VRLLVIRGTSDRNLLCEFCTTFTQIVEQHCKYIVVSGFLAIASGRSRSTEDIDMIIDRLSLDRFTVLHHALILQGFTCMQSDSPKEIYEYLDELASVRYTWKDRPLPEMELKFSKDALDDYQLKTRRKIPFTGLDVWFSSVDVNVAFKEEYLKSEKDLADARHLRLIFKDVLDEGEIRKIKEMIRVYRLS